MRAFLSRPLTGSLFGRKGRFPVAASTARHWRSRGTRSAYHHRVRHAVCAGVRLQYRPHAEVVLPRGRSATGHRGSMRPGRPLRHSGLRGPVAPCLRHWFALGKSGQPRPYVRPARRGYAAGHHGCARAWQAPISRACSGHRACIGIACTVLTTASPITLFSACCRIRRACARHLPRASEHHAVAAEAVAASPFAW